MAFRPPSLSCFNRNGESPSVIRGQNYTVHRLGGGVGEAHSISSTDETLFIFPEGGGELATAAETRRIPPRALVIAPAGTTNLRFGGSDRAYALTTGAGEMARGLAINAATYREPDPRVKQVGRPFEPVASRRDHLRVYPVDDIPFPAGNPRLKFLQTATMSVNWVEYDGPRDRTKLSPHAHDDFEQGSLAISGRFLHHIRAPWISDANQWRPDEHIEAASDSLLVIPPQLIHTTEGVGSGRHVLIDVFAPPRQDFIAKGWVHNAADYACP